jgi:heme oxygenase
VITAKVKCASKSPIDSDQFTVRFEADYNDGRNAEWAKFTPALSVSMNVKAEAAAHFEPGTAYTLTFTPSED